MDDGWMDGVSLSNLLLYLDHPHRTGLKFKLSIS